MSTRNLTVMFTDLSGFTEAASGMSRDQIEQFLSAHDRLIRPIILRRKGGVVKTIGDSFLATFESPTDAVLAGIDIQQAVEDYNALARPREKMQIRVSINVGEVTEKEGDIYGDAVNIASRLLSVAEPNGVYFTEAVYLVMNKKEVPTAEVGHRQFRGVPEKIRVYRVLRELPPKPVKHEEKVMPGYTLEPGATPKSTPWVLWMALTCFALAGLLAVIGIFLRRGQKQPVAVPSLPPAITGPASTKPSPQAKPLPPARPSFHPKQAASPGPKPGPIHDTPSPKPAAILHPAPKPKPPEARSAAIILDSVPQGAAIVYRGQPLGLTARKVDVSPGVHTFILRLRGYQEESVTISVKAGDQVAPDPIVLKRVQSEN